MKKHTLTYTDPDGLEFKVSWMEVPVHPLEALKQMAIGVSHGMGYDSETIDEYFPED